MKVKIGNRIFDSKKEPIMIVLKDYEKEHIAEMSEDSHKYCSFPADMTESEARNFMIIPQEDQE